MKRGDLHVGRAWTCCSDMDQHQLCVVVGEGVLRRTAEADKGLKIQMEDMKIWVKHVRKNK